jgi:glycosyltransferase involved in cell wall biosynthesis
VNIAFDLRRIGNAGVGRYMQCLVSELLRIAPEHHYIFIMLPGTEHLIGHHPQARIVLTRAKYYSFVEQFILPRIVRRYRVDVLHAMHFVVPLWKRCPTVVTVHDAIHLIYPQDLPSWLGQVYARWMMWAAVRVADRVITVSEHAKSDICRLLQASPEKVTAVHLAADSNLRPVTDQDALQRMRERLGIPEKYILYTGICKERKNHATLLRAVALLRQENLPVKLVIAGRLGQGESKLVRLAKELNISGDVIFTGFVPEEDLAALYSAARAYVCPSLYEGFGFTVLEASACGTAVVCHNDTSLPEVCGDSALLVDARDPRELADGIHRVWQDDSLRESLIQRGFENLKRFSYERTARRTLDVYRQVSGQPAAARVMAET